MTIFLRHHAILISFVLRLVRDFHTIIRLSSVGESEAKVSLISSKEGSPITTVILIFGEICSRRPDSYLEFPG